MNLGVVAPMRLFVATLSEQGRPSNVNLLRVVFGEGCGCADEIVHCHPVGTGQALKHESSPCGLWGRVRLRR
jgi:hypothetical protein